MYYDFHIPKDVVKYLLSEEQILALVEQGNTNKTPGVWWVKFGSLFYFDLQGEQQRIERNSESMDTKWPDTKEFIEVDEEDEE
jgi:hypothetical protein